MGGWQLECSRFWRTITGKCSQVVLEFRIIRALPTCHHDLERSLTWIIIRPSRIIPRSLEQKGGWGMIGERQMCHQHLTQKGGTRRDPHSCLQPSGLRAWRYGCATCPTGKNFLWVSTVSWK